MLQGDIKRSIDIKVPTESLKTAEAAVNSLSKVMDAMYERQIANLDKVMEKRNQEISMLEEQGVRTRELAEIEMERLKTKEEIENVLAEQRIKELEDVSQNLPEAEKQQVQDAIDRERNRIETINAVKDIAKTKEELRIIALQKLNEADELKKRQLQKKQFDLNKAASLVSASISGAMGVVNALTIQPVYLVPVAMALAIAASATSIATIASQPNPYHKGTLRVPGHDESKDSVHAILTPGEAVIPVDRNKAY